MGIGRKLGFSSEDPAEKGVYDNRFLVPSFIEIISNEYDWRDLGSWVFDLNSDVGKFNHENFLSYKIQAFVKF